MKTFLILCCCVFALEALRIKKSNPPTNFVDMVKNYGYPVESFDVQTEDGYILNLFRIPSGSKQRTKRFEDNSDSSSSSAPEENKRVLFMMHGLMSNAESFVYGGPSESLALWLADAGYDVFLGNARGSIYGQRHTTLDPQKDASFWRFCWQDMGTKDLPAMIDKALSVSGQNKLSYIGHNEGSTSFYVLASEKPEYNSKMERHISLGPLVFMKNGEDEVMETIQQHISSKSEEFQHIHEVVLENIQPSSRNYDSKTMDPKYRSLNFSTSDCNLKFATVKLKFIDDEAVSANTTLEFILNASLVNHITKIATRWIMKNLGMNTFAPTNELMEEAKMKCMSKKNDEQICKNIYFLLNGYNSEHFNQTTINQMISRVPSTASVREIMHFVQLRSTGRFQKYSEESQAEEFDLSKVTVPVALFYTPNDQLYSSEDVQMLAGKLPNMYKQMKFENLNNNLDFLYSEDMNNVQEEIKKALTMYKEKSD